MRTCTEKTSTLTFCIGSLYFVHNVAGHNGRGYQPHRHVFGLRAGRDIKQRLKPRFVAIRKKALPFSAKPVGSGSTF